MRARIILYVSRTPRDRVVRVDSTDQTDSPLPREYAWEDRTRVWYIACRRFVISNWSTGRYACLLTSRYGMPPRRKVYRGPKVCTYRKHFDSFVLMISRNSLSTSHSFWNEIAVWEALNFFQVCPLEIQFHTCRIEQLIFCSIGFFAVIG